jgi:hypothetical protein
MGRRKLLAGSPPIHYRTRSSLKPRRHILNDPRSLLDIRVKYPSPELHRVQLNVHIVIRCTTHYHGESRSSAVDGEEIGRGDMRAFGQ